MFRGSDQYPEPSPRPVVTIGNFDGVHPGHRSLVARAVALADEMGVPACVYTFDPAPRDVLRPDNSVPRIQSLADRVVLLGECGVDHVVVEAFTREFGGNGPAWFASEVLSRRLCASAVVVGWDFRFGRGREGTFEHLRDLMAVPVEQVCALTRSGHVISSSRIREAVKAGDVGLACSLLERPHVVVGTVVHGDARGREIGFPTANVVVDTGLVPQAGVYAVRALIDGRWRDGVANVGVRPTFEGTDLRFEVHVLDWSGALYGQTLRVQLIALLREERSFDGVPALVEQIRRDVVAAREVLA